MGATLISVGCVLFLSNVDLLAPRCSFRSIVRIPLAFFFLFPGAETTMKWWTIMTGVWDYKSGVVGQVV